MTYWKAPAFIALFAISGCSAAAGSGEGSNESDMMESDGDSTAGDGDGDADPIIIRGDGDETDGSGGAHSAAGGTQQYGDGGTSAAASGGAGPTGMPPPSDCTPNPSGAFVTDAVTVFDEKTCLTWMRSNTSGDPYAQAVVYCDGLELDGYADWRLPTAGEAATIFRCENNMWPYMDDTVFNISGDGFWTSTESGSIAGDETKVCAAGQSSGSFYDFGKVGGQHTRCVRGANTVPDRTDCKTNTQICQ